MLPKKASTTDHSEYSVAEERLNTATHALGFCLAIIGLIALIEKSRGTSELVTAWVYGTSLALMFLSSSLYHISHQPQRRAMLRKVDHTAIYLLIAGSYTPFLFIAVGDTLGLVALAVVWLIGILGIIFKLTVGHQYPKLAVSTYALMGWFAILLIYPIYQALPATGFVLLVIGGLCYSAGIPLYMLKSRHFSHALWHVCVVAGAACHFFAIYYYVLGSVTTG